MTIVPEDLFKLVLALLVGGLIGIERELRHKTAGFRTIILICTGATLFTMFSYKIDGTGRVAANIVSGVGFIGVGVILHDATRIIGLTTASTVWLSAALGMGIGSGQYILTVMAAVLVVVVLWLFPKFEWRLERARQVRSYEITCLASEDKFEQIDAVIRECGLHIDSRKRIKQGEDMVCTWTAHGGMDNHDSFTAKLFADPDVKQFEF